MKLYQYNVVYVFMFHTVKATVKERVKASILQRIHDGHLCRKCACDAVRICSAA